MSNSHTLLITSAGRRAELLQCFRRSAHNLSLQLRVVGAEAQPELSAACHLADGAERLPRCSDPSYVPILLDLCRREGVSLLVPTIDTELGVLSQHQDEFRRAGARVVISEPSVVGVARDKQATANRLLKAEVKVPHTMSLAQYRANPVSLPGDVLAKPAGGSSSVGILRGRGPEDFSALPEAGYLVQELKVGTEYTVNMFFDQAGFLRCAVPHRRIEVRTGEVSKGRTERVPVLEEAAKKIAKALPGARGPLCFQAIVSADGDYAVFEINARFGGGYPLAHAAGATFTQWLLEESAGLRCSAHNEWRSGVTMLRYDAAVFVDG